MIFTREQAVNLLEFFGDDNETEVDVVTNNGELLAYYLEYPEEGSIEL